MVSGFLTSPYDQDRIISGDASPIRMESNSSICPWDLSRFSKSFKAYTPRSVSRAADRTARDVGSRWLFGFQVDIDGQRTDFLDQHVEGLGHAGLHVMVAVHDVLVHLGTAVHVIRLHSQHLLQGVGGTVGFQCPDLHLPEALTAELSLTTQRLLCDQTVGTGRTGVHLVVDQVVQLEHVHVAHSHRPVEGVAGTAVVQGHLTAVRQVRQTQHVLDLVLFGTIEHRGRHGHTAAQVVRQLDDLAVAEGVKVFLTTAHLVVHLVEELAQLGDLALLVEHAVDLLAQALGCQTQMGLEDLTDVHPRRYAQRVEHDVHRHAVLVVRHVFHRHDDRDDTLVTMTAGHLVTGLDAALDSQVDLDDLQHARSQVIALLQLALLVLELLVEQLATVNQVGLGALQLFVEVVLAHAQLEPLAALDALEDLGGQHCALLHAGTTFNGVTDQGSGQTLESGGFNDADLVELLFLDGQGTAVAFHAITGEHLDVDDGTLGAGGHTQGSVLHVGGLLTENRTQQLLLRSQLGFALGRDLADQDVAGADLGTNIDDTGLIQLAQRRFTDVGNIGGDLLRPQLGVAGHAGQFLDVDCGETVFLYHALGDEDGVLEVVAVPGHEGHAHVLTQGQLAHVHGGTISQDVAGSNHVTSLHQRPLVDAGVLVGTGVLGQGVDIHTSLASFHLVIIDADNDTTGVYRVHYPAATGSNTDPGVLGHVALHAGTDQRLLGAQSGHGLTLHVRTHEGAVGIVVLEEGNQRSGHGDHLTGGHVHQGDFFGRLDAELVHVADGNQLFNQLAITHFGAGLGDDVIGFFDRRQEHDLVGYHGVLDATVGAFEEAVLVGPGVGGQGVDQTDVRTFRGLDRADATIVGRVYVTHLEAGTFTGQTTRPERGDAALVGDLRQRVVLVHELGQLAGTEELLDCRCHRLGVDQVLGHQAFALGHGQTLLDRALHAHQAHAELVLGHFANGADTTVTQVIDVVDHALAVTDVDQGLEHLDDVFLAQHARAFDLFATDAAVELHAAHGGQVVAVAAEEQVAEQGFGGVLGRRLAGAHHAVDLHQGIELAGGGIDTQGVGDEGTAVDIVGVQGLQMGDTCLDQLLDQFGADFGVAFDQDFTGGRMHDRLGDGTADQVVEGHFEAGNPGLLQLVDVSCSDTTAFLDDHLALAIGDVEGGDLATQALRHQLQLQGLAVHLELVGVVEDIQNFLGLITQGAQQHGRRQLAAAVDTDEDRILGIELEVQPGAAVGNHAGGIQQLAGAVCLATVVVEEHTRAAVQLGNDHTLGTIDHEGTVLGHQGYFTHVDFLLLDVLDRLAGRFTIKDDQAHFNAQRNRIGHATQHTFLDVESRLTQPVTDILERRITGIADNGENRFEGRVQTDITNAVLVRVGLQEFPVGIQLDRQQIGHVHHMRQFAKVLADTFFLSV